jgi:chaperonin cofactor prefoldin
MLWVILIILIFLFAGGGVAFSLFRKVNQQKEIVLLNLKTLQTELEEKKKILEELGAMSLGLISTAQLDEIQSSLSGDEEALRTVKGKATLLQAEAEAVDIRLRELEEIERELEASSIEAGREMELLRAQERDMGARNTKLTTELESYLIQLDKLLLDAADDPKLIEALKKAREQLEIGQSQLKHFESEIPLINEKYMGLKRAYDALDIEYAQLYEKQSKG